MEETVQRYYLERFEDYLRFERGLSANTAAAYSTDVDQLVAFLESRGFSSPDDVGAKELREFVYRLKRAGRAANSIRRKVSAIRSYFGFLQAEGLTDTDPSELLERPKTGRRLPTVLTRGEVERLLSTPQGDEPLALRDRAILELMYATGVRVSELVALRLRDVDLEEQLLRVHGKRSKERVVPFGETARTTLKRYLRTGRPRLSDTARGRGEARLFLGRRGTALTRKGAWQVIQRRVSEAGIGKRVTPHTLRHTFATHLLQGGADVAAVQEMLGHADISTTQIYTHLDRTYLSEVHRRYHPRG